MRRGRFLILIALLLVLSAAGIFVAFMAMSAGTGSSGQPNAVTITCYNLDGEPYLTESGSRGWPRGDNSYALVSNDGKSTSYISGNCILAAN